MQVRDNGKGARLIWTWDFKPDELAGAIEPILDAAADGMRAALA